MGNSRKTIQGFPKGVQKLAWDELQLIQFGGMPKDVKPFKGVGSGVFEIAIRFNKDAYRTVLAVQLGEKIYVLHAFQKKSTMLIRFLDKCLVSCYLHIHGPTWLPDFSSRVSKGVP